ncbi:MAG: hypothetical protein K2P78_02585 [Gemmataceae bacterium]|nr:hypothetical protein [Gemmataceae bacterium]
MAPGEDNLVRIDVIHGGDNRVELGEVKSVGELKRVTKDNKRTTYLATTLRWTAVR